MSLSQLLWATHRCQRDNGTLKVGKHWISLLSMELCCMAYIVSSVVQPTCTVVFPKWVYLLWACITHKHSASGWIGLANHWNSVAIICQQLMWKVLLVWFTNAGKNIAVGQKCMLISIWYYARFYLFLAPTPNWELCHCSLNGIYFSTWPIKWLCAELSCYMHSQFVHPYIHPALFSIFEYSSYAKNYCFLLPPLPGSILVYVLASCVACVQIIGVATALNEQ